MAAASGVPLEHPSTGAQTPATHGGLDGVDYLIATALVLDAELLTTNVRRFRCLPVSARLTDPEGRSAIQSG